MSTPNQPDDTSSDRAGVTPPWKRGEKSAATGLTAGQMAKAAGAIGDDRPGPGTGSGSGPASAGRPPGPPRPNTPGPAPAAPPAAPQGSSQSGSGPQAPGPHGSGAQGSGSQSVGSPGSGQQGFVESATRNIPREDLAKRDELPDLDSIHHTEQVKEQAIARATSQTIPARSVSTPLRAAVQLRRVDPWSVFKISGVLSVAGFFVWMIAVAILYGVLDGMGIWEQINSSFGTLVSADGTSTGDDLISGGQVFTMSALFGVVAAILITGLTTISAYIYNVCADMVGGVEVTLADLD
ncbi:DUF3566 domain-containing protein [Gordonia shandongensis]|uniref:DUF3566 domain-containing protein n=1 Tax=Gordonia shandongensis TaxID=376351 RepID=UPI000406508E|nr:DUF3566 domain-containing protein [Gordonia shandongensis]